MANLTFLVANTTPFVGQPSAALFGKNGSKSSLGTVKPLVLNTELIDTSITFSVSNLHLMYDDNFDSHLLEARNNTQLVTLKGQSPDNLLRYNLNIKSASNTAGAAENTVGHDSTLVALSSNITSFDITANTLTIDYNTAEVATVVKNALLPSPFYVELQQLIEPTISSSNTFFISGDLNILSNTHNVANQAGTMLLPIGVAPPAKGLISTFVNGSLVEEEVTEFSWSAGDNYINHNISSSDLEIITSVENYSSPAFESKDNIFIVDNEQLNTINSVSYIASSPTYNTSLTASDFFKVTLTDNIASSVGKTTIMNTSEDLIADISSIDTINKQVTLTYDELKYDKGYELANNGVYILCPFSYNDFNSVTLVDNKIQTPATAGVFVFQVSAVNEFNRSSVPITQSVATAYPPLGQVSETEVVLTENLFRDRTKGVMSRVIGQFPHIINRNVKTYDISYKIVQLSGADSHPSGMTNFTSFMVDANEAGEDGNIHFVISNLDLGQAGNTYSLQVKILPINGLISGIPVYKSLTLSGKSDRPLELNSFNITQTNDSIVFDVEYPVDSQNNLDELDILHTEVRSLKPVVGIDNQNNINDAFLRGDKVMLLPHPLSRAEVSLDRFTSGSYTFTAKTVDTSGNYSLNALARNLQVEISTQTDTLAIWNEAAPNTNISSSVGNYNYGDNVFVGVTEVDNGGLVYHIDPITSPILGVDTPSSLAEDANASANGFSWAQGQSQGFDKTDLLITSANSVYISPVRDLGSVVRGNIVVSSLVNSSLLEKFLEVSQDLIVGVSEGHSSHANVLFDSDFEIGTVTGYNNSESSFSFSNTHNTIIDGSANNKVFVIVNPGQEVIGSMDAADDVSNIHSYALIAGAINTNAIELSAVYYANGKPVPTGNSTNSTALSNITQSGSTYKLVDMNQFVDAFGARDFSPDVEVSKNVYVRFSSANVFEASDNVSSKPHGNVNISLFEEGDDDENWQSNYFGLRRFRYFQVKTEFDINDYGDSANTFIDELNYEVRGIKKEFTTVVSSTNKVQGNLVVDYSSAEFFRTPTVFTQILSANTSLISRTSDLTNESCNVTIFNTQNGNVIDDADIEITISATGA